MGNGILCPLKYILVLSLCSPTSQMISQIWLQQFCCTIKTKHANVKYTEGLFHPGMMHRDTFHNSQKCILIILTDRREHNSSCCQDRGCAVVTLPELHRKNQVWHHNSRKFRAWFSISKELWMKIVPCITNISGIQTEGQRHHRGIHFAALFCYGKGFSCSLHSAASKSKGTELMWSNQQI